MRVCLNLTCNSAFVHISPHSLLSTVNLPENFGYDLMNPVFHDSDPSRVDFVRKTSSTSFISSWLVDTISHILLFMILVCYRPITYSYFCVSQLLGRWWWWKEKLSLPSTRLMGTKTLGWVSPRDRASMVSLVAFYLLINPCVWFTRPTYHVVKPTLNRTGI